MRKRLLAALTFVLLAVVLGAGARAAITPPSGAIPSGLPARMLVGLFESYGASWMKSSAVPWDVRYSYMSKGWANNWGYGAYDGSYASRFLTESDADHFIPAIQFYQLVGEAGGAESADYTKTQNAGTMASYFGDFKLLMQRAKEFGKPTIVMIEADGTGFLQQQTGSNPGAYSAIAASGLPELSTLPNTVAGWGLAFLQIRKAVGANNVTLGLHVSAWAGNKDIAYTSVTDPLPPEVDKVYNFLAPFGLTTNVTGATYDFLVGDPLDRDPDFYRLTRNDNRWLDPSDSASVNSKSFNRCAEWLRLFNVKTGKRWLLWQIPLGNSNHLNVYNNNAPRQGYKGNFPEYFFGANSRAHLEKFASSGVFGVLFGAGAEGQSSFTNDTYPDGKGFMQSRAGDFLKAGGLAIPVGTTTNPPPPPPPPPPETVVYNFDSTTQGWASSGAPIVAVSRSSAQKFAGASSLAVQINGSGSAFVSVANPTARAGQTVTFHIFLQAGPALAWVQPYVQEGAAGNWTWTGNWQPTSNLRAGNWNTLTVQVPGNAAALSSLGVQFATSSSYNGSLFVDSVSF